MKHGARTKKGRKGAGPPTAVEFEHGGRLSTRVRGEELEARSWMRIKTHDSEFIS